MRCGTSRERSSPCRSAASCRSVELGLEERACIVTGASRGIGLATARALCGEGAHVLLTARGEEALADAVEACAEAGGRAEGVAVDIRADDAGERLTRACEERFGSAEVLVNNAGT